MNRRSLLGSTLLAVAALPPRWSRSIDTALADAKTWRHGVSSFGNLKYPVGFSHFEYVNADAPKGGSARDATSGTFDNFNGVVAGVKGTLPASIDLIYETLLVPSLDEISTAYGLLAEAVSFPADFSLATYRLNKQAKWHDGTPVTPDDVIFSFEAVKKYSPQLSAHYRHISKAEKTGDREVTFTADASGNRELPRIIGELTVLPKKWWEGADPNGNKRNIGETTLEPPLGSGPYRIKDFSAGHYIVYERVKDHWSNGLNVNVGFNNFDELHYEYFRDTTAALEAFKANVVDWRYENSAKDWATGYDFPAVSDKRVLRDEFAIRNIGVMQAFAFNIRRRKFQDPRVRLAFNYVFNFEEMNKQFFFDQYKRIASYFAGSELAATGLPAGRELELLEALRDQVPAEVFTMPYTNPINGSPEAVRNNLREAMRLLKQAGYEVRDQQLVDVKTGEPYVIEFLSEGSGFDRVFLSYKQSLDRLGIATTMRTVDEVQYQNRLRSWDFDIITARWPVSLTPSNELHGYWGSRAAEEPGSPNRIGIKNPAVDAMIDQIVFAKNRADLEAAASALDRILLWNHYVVPQWYYNIVRAARWDRFGHPDLMPKYGGAAFPAVWWWDVQKAAKER
jgi:microcin C transport system substrate-binding protein